jgi:hypothetical protein
VSRFNLGVLGATALLGVLLWVVLAVVAEFARGPQPPPPGEPPPLPPGFIRIADHAGLRTALAERGIAPDVPLQGWRDWLAQRGFYGELPLLGIDAERARERFYDHLEPAALDKLAAQSDLGALHRLAAQRRLSDPPAAVRLYRQAVDRGSTAAMLELSALYDTLARMSDDDWPGERPDPAMLDLLDGDGPARDLREESLAWLLAALRDGGEALADPDRLAWARGMAAALEPTRRNAACSRSLNLFLTASVARRAAGLPPVRSAPPPLFVAVADLTRDDPCAGTTAPLEPVLDLADCAAEPALDARGRELRLWVCPSALQ